MIAFFALACTRTTATLPVAHETASLHSGSTSDPTGATGATGHSAAPHLGPGNVLVVLVDDIGIDKVGAYGVSGEIRTPVIDGLAADGILFRNAWATPVCSPSRAALQTGRHARRTGYGSNNNNTNGNEFDLAPDDLTLAELLALDTERTWSTALYGKWHLGPGTPATTQGYGDFAGSLANVPSYYSWTKTLADGTSVESTTYVTTDTVDDVVTALEVLTEPWLIVVSLNAAHDPWHVPPRELYTGPDLAPDAPKLERERADLEAADRELGRLLDAIPPAVRRRTTTMVIGDNGTPDDVAEPGSPGHGKMSMDESGLRVPFVVQGPLVGVRGSASSALVSVVDVFPTVADIAGIDVSDRALDGVSLLPALADPTVGVHTTLWSERFTPNGAEEPDVDERAVRDERYKIVSRKKPTLDEIRFHELAPDGWDDGPDLLENALTPDQTAAWERLKSELEARTAAMEADLPWPP
ncbi:MAG: sulfatase-like hydrolase/transferase [Alphaproteobacteria bacterium]|nr:sulfatase-like hydrolase/transferase [Alphaproteobacteria bacterium]